MQKLLFSKTFPVFIRLIAASGFLTAFLISCGREPAEPDHVPGTFASDEKNAGSATESASSAEIAAATESRERVVYPSEDHSGDKPVIYVERVYYDGAATPEQEKTVYLRAPANTVDVVIPDGVTEIGGEAFHDCIKLESVVFPEGVKTIGIGAFAGCQKLERVSLPASLKTIGESAFANCPSLKEIAIPENVTEIGTEAFHDCPCEESVRRLMESRGIATPPSPSPESN